MRLGLIDKLKAVLRKGLGLKKTASSTPTGGPTTSQKLDHTCVVLKEKKRSVQIMCWNCSHRLWVQKGSQCHTIGLCSKCIGGFDAKTGTIKSRK